MVGSLPLDLLNLFSPVVSITGIGVGVEFTFVLVVVEISFLLFFLPVARVLVGCLEVDLAVMIAVLVAAQIAVEIPGARVDGLLPVFVSDRDLANRLVGNIRLNWGFLG